jgi:hypothetical protein
MPTSSTSHTWYTHLGGIMAKLAYGIPHVITVHSLEPLRPWKREQLGGGYDFSVWVERTAMEMADSIVAVSSGTRNDVLRNISTWIRPRPHHLQRNRSQRVPKGRHHGHAAEVRHRSEPALCALRRPHHAAEGHQLPARAIKYMNPVTSVVLVAGAPDNTRDCRRDEDRD